MIACARLAVRGDDNTYEKKFNNSSGEIIEIGWPGFGLYSKDLAHKLGLEPEVLKEFCILKGLGIRYNNEILLYDYDVDRICEELNIEVLNGS